MSTAKTDTHTYCVWLNEYSLQASEGCVVVRWRINRDSTRTDSRAQSRVAFVCVQLFVVAKYTVNK